MSMVEWKKLADIANILYGYPFESSLFTEDNSYIPLIRIRDVKPAKASTYYSGDIIDNYIIKRGDILVGMDGEFNLGKWNDRNGLLNQRVLKMSGKCHICENGYLYHYMGPVFKKIEKETPGGSVKHLSAKVINKITIPIPSLSEQNRIVGILDTFTSSIENLKEQIALRRKQYEYYRDQLLDLEGKEAVETKEVAYFVKDRISANKLDTKNYTSVENLQKDKAGRKDAENVPTDGNWIKYQKGDILIGNIRPYLRKIWLSDRDGGTNGDVIVVRANDGISHEFLYYCLSSERFFLYYNQSLKDGKMPRGEKSRVLTYAIPSISINEQQRIVFILDTFEASIQNLEAQLKEREKQYEYYRNKLLTFE